MKLIRCDGGVHQWSTSSIVTHHVSSTLAPFCLTQMCAKGLRRVSTSGREAVALSFDYSHVQWRQHDLLLVQSNKQDRTRCVKNMTGRYSFTSLNHVRNFRTSETTNNPDLRSTLLSSSADHWHQTQGPLTRLFLIFQPTQMFCMMCPSVNPSCDRRFISMFACPSAIDYWI